MDGGTIPPIKNSDTHYKKFDVDCVCVSGCVNVCVGGWSWHGVGGYGLARWPGKPGGEAT